MWKHGNIAIIGPQLSLSIARKEYPGVEFHMSSCIYACAGLKSRNWISRGSHGARYILVNISRTSNQWNI